jgi:hypothetical protein
MSGNASVHFPPDGTEKTLETTARAEALAVDPSADNLVARAFAILAEEQERWRSARSASLPSRRSS